MQGGWLFGYCYKENRGGREVMQAGLLVDYMSNLILQRKGQLYYLATKEDLLRGYDSKISQLLY